ncbi:transcriptional regulator [candidate division KSB1 bacterium]|nr:transcriptional regulator [candidate division KSB1 bacterium]MBL7092570.1 transcriptional regulator [candidate division KSB1 bacterium]
MKTLTKEFKKTIEAWHVVSNILSTIHTEEQYNNAVDLLDTLINKVTKGENFIIESLIDTLGTLIKDYEDRNFPEPEGDPIGCLKFLMNEHDIKEYELIELGSRNDILNILEGKKHLNVEQIKALSKKFHVSPAVFI